jgi:hypothetical protein
MSCVNVQLIDPDECIGASLPKINGNFAALSAAVCNLSGSVGFEVVDSPTIDLDWNASTRTLSAVTTSMVATSASPMVAKAWVNFDGTFATSPFTIANGGIRSAYNVSSITDDGAGSYIINFSSGTFVDSDYCYLISLEVNAQGVNAAAYGQFGTKSSSQCRFVTDDTNAANNNDFNTVCVAFFR